MRKTTKSTASTIFFGRHSALSAPNKPAAVRRNGSGADVAGTITVTLNAVSNEKRRIIGSVLLGEKKEPSGAAIEAVIAEAGEDAWSVGKALNMRPEDVLELNPRLSEPLSEPTRIVVYHKL